MALVKKNPDFSFRNENDLRKYLPYSYHVTPTVISTPNGCLFTIFKLAGRAFECVSEDDKWHWYRDLNHIVRAIGTPHMELWTHMHHRRVTDYPASVFQSKFARDLDAAYRQKVDDTAMMVNDLYLTLVYNPIADVTQRVLAKMESVSAAVLLEQQTDGIQALEEAADIIQTVMRSYSPQRLGLYYRDDKGAVVPVDENQEPEEDDDDSDDDLLADTSQSEVVAADFKKISNPHTYSSALEFLGFLVNGEFQPVPVCHDRINTYLATNRTVFSLFGDIVQVRSDDRIFYSAGIEITDYDESTYPGQLNGLMRQPFEFVLSQSFTCISPAAARTALTRQQASLLETGDAAISQITELTVATDDVTSRRYIMGYHHCTVHVFGNTQKEVQKYSRSVRAELTQSSVTAASVGLAAKAAWYGKLPANGKYRPRPVLINSGNFVCFSPFHNYMSGKPSGNPWGQAVSMFVTPEAKTPLFFNWHSTPLGENSVGKRPAGHGLMLGKTGSGKTTLLAALLAMETKYCPRMFIYDKDQGLFPLVKALGGEYTILQEGRPSGWQPLQMEPTRRNVAFVKRLVRMLAEVSNNGPLHPLDAMMLAEAVENVMGADSLIPRKDRTMSALWDMIPAPIHDEEGRVPVKTLIEEWTQQGEHGWLFDNSSDSIDLNTRDIHAFDLTEFIVGEGQEPPKTRAPMLLYLLFRVRESIDGARHVVQVFDEFAQYLDDPTLALEIKRGLKTDRKKDAIYLFATQEPNDALESSIGKTIVQAVVTLILLYNPEALPEDYIKGLKLSPAEYQKMLEIPENSRQFLVKQGGQAALAGFDLSGLDDAISILSGTPDNSRVLREIIDQVGDNPDVWLPLYYKAVRRG